MKTRLSSLLLALLLLSACGGKPSDSISPSEEETLVTSAAVSLPETHSAGAVSAPAIVTEGRAPAEDYELPPSLAAAQDEPRYNMERWVNGGVIELLAEAPDADAAFYGLPLYADNSGGAALIRWGDSLAEFDWTFCPGPIIVLPWIGCFDIDGDQEDELVVICHIGSGTGVSISELHIIEKGPDRTLIAYTFPELLWQEQLPKMFNTAKIGDRIFVVLGRELVEIDGEGLDLETASSGLIARFCKEDWEELQFQGAFALCYEGSAVPCYVAETSAQIGYQDGVFTLQHFHLYS